MEERDKFDDKTDDTYSSPGTAGCGKRSMKKLLKTQFDQKSMGSRARHFTLPKWVGYLESVPRANGRLLSLNKTFVL
ncbi:hypothetical protein [Dyadobacter bucti]|uniref:hypothetical protein n=1 Tax=Dyadobacter bucti TaxID=2572203 RepID=UPI001107E965|nr:hypothetical protein [Dyadobacter bucti]